MELNYYRLGRKDDVRARRTLGANSRSTRQSSTDDIYFMDDETIVVGEDIYVRWTYCLRSLISQLLIYLRMEVLKC